MCCIAGGATSWCPCESWWVNVGGNDPTKSGEADIGHVSTITTKNSLDKGRYATYQSQSV